MWLPKQVRGKFNLPFLNLCSRNECFPKDGEGIIFTNRQVSSFTCLPDDSLGTEKCSVSRYLSN